MKKRGISAVVATILIILIVVVGVGIVWKVVLPIFAELEFLSYSDVRLNIVFQGHTVYDSNQNFAFVQIERGKDQVNVTGVEIGFNFDGMTKTYQSDNVPTPNGKYTYKFNFTNDSEFGIPEDVAPDKVTVAPIFTINNKVRLGKILDEKPMPSGRIHLSAEAWKKANDEAAIPIVVTTGSGSGDEPGEPVNETGDEPTEDLRTVIYVAEGYYRGALASLYGGSDGRQTADAICMNNKPNNFPPSCNGIHAFLSVNSSDELRDMPDNYLYDSSKPIYWWNDSNQQYSKFANDWSDMFDGSILISQLDGTGVPSNPDTAPDTWSGSNSDGSLAENCNSWEVDSGIDMFETSGKFGTFNNLTGRWLSYSSISCDYSWRIRCVGVC